MKHVFAPCPQLTDRLFQKLGFQEDAPVFQGVSPEGIHTLLETENQAPAGSSSVLSLIDRSGKWQHQTDGLDVTISFTIQVPKFLFGPNGLAAADGSVIGVGVEWIAAESSVRGIYPLGEIRAGEAGPAEISHTISFPGGLLRGSLILRTVLYLAAPGNRTAQEKFLASRTGTILGTLQSAKVLIDGNGSLFPIHEKADKTMPLWWVDTSDWDDPTEEKFSDDTFCLYLNPAHRDYAQLEIKDGLKGNPLMTDILCSAIQILITKVYSWVQQESLDLKHIDPDLDTIAGIARYLAEQTGVTYDPERPERMARDIRRYYQSKL